MSDVNDSSSKVNERNQKKEALKERLQKRKEERLAALEKRKAEKSKDYNVNEESTQFMEVFNNNKKEIENKLSENIDFDNDQLKQHFDSLAVEIQKLKKMLADAVIFLPPYDIRVVQDSIKSLQEKVVQKEELLLPKKKFAFKNRNKELEKKKKAEVGDVVDFASSNKSENAKALEVSIPDILLYDCGFQNVSDQNLKLDFEEINLKDVGLHNLTNCEVRLEGVSGTLHICNVVGSKIFSGPVKTSIFVENCTDCTFILSCQQLRTHSTKNTDIYLHITSNPIIEECTNIRFAPYSWTYPSIEEHFALAEFDREKNNWNSVKDFNWLLNSQSPHWDILPENERLQFD